jgi:hypothetical protein
MHLFVVDRAPVPPNQISGHRIPPSSGRA